MSRNFQELARVEGCAVVSGNRPVVCVQGLGFVGVAMALAVANARDEKGEPCFHVIGVDLPNEAGRAKAKALNAGKLPIESADPKMAQALDRAITQKNFFATTNADSYEAASITIVDIHLDLDQKPGEPPTVNFDGLKKAVRTIAERMPDRGLILVETTVPPGTCERVLLPEIEATLARMGRAPGSLLLAHSYERVMPGDQYFDSIVNFWRVFSGTTPAAADACEAFLKKVINVRDFPLTRLSSPTASETAKVLENSYRAVNIAFMEEWGRFAESTGTDMFEIVNAIRVRPTHSNIRQPGFGVGGYCLTKDPLFGMVSSRDLFNLDLQFPFCEQAIELNQKMPLVTLEKLRSRFGSLRGKRLLLLGISYRQDVSDTRYSPSEAFASAALNEGAALEAYDPFVKEWAEVPVKVHAKIPPASSFDAVVLAVPHAELRDWDYGTWLKGGETYLFDANQVLETRRLRQLGELGIEVGSIGRGNLS